MPPLANHKMSDAPAAPSARKREFRLCCYLFDMCICNLAEALAFSPRACTLKPLPPVGPGVRHPPSAAARLPAPRRRVQEVLLPRCRARQAAGHERGGGEICGRDGTSLAAAAAAAAAVRRQPRRAAPPRAHALPRSSLLAAAASSPPTALIQPSPLARALARWWSCCPRASAGVSPRAWHLRT